MLVDDDSGVRRALGAILTSSGYDVVLAEDGADAVRRWRGLDRGDLIIMDLFMPEKNGLEAIVELRTHSPHVPIIAITGGGGTGRMDILQDAKLLGAVEGLEKPFSPQVLLDLVAQTLANA
jgi:CheY-like chemotaxis protein